MALFQLDPGSIATRVRQSGDRVPIPTLGASILRGTVGFMLVSVAGFAPWPIIDRWLPAAGEVGLYVMCTAMFIGLSGPLLRRLIIGPGSLARFYKLFALAFLAYAAAWVACWMSLRGNTGGYGGLLAGTAAMGLVFAAAFDSLRQLGAVILVLFLLNTLGYSAGSWIEHRLGFDHRLAAIVLWGLCYGAGFGAGLGVALHLCQSRARNLIAGDRSP